MSSAFKLNLYTPKGVIVRDLDCVDVVVPTVRGEINLLPEHTHILTELGTGVLTVKSQQGVKYFTVTAGLCRVLKDTITILSFTSEKSNDIDVERAKRAKAKATDKLSGKEAISDADLLKYRRKLERAELRLRLSLMK